ncbi:MogA/MoaB family molybdenum cofactor biosynthesis protein [Sporolactobacillus shoreae]|uniref:Molybdenum cofactor biosynthesis protein B n=1 Tax=Sporolactobacillus shoreae TaxID=1465501 RepID=A0A4Z0GRN8_9BACL|nr:MogA/MoaB family molybdenum cofactor biosynthesis protein [Sporolactobacillus shoreae]TGB00011.1 MogA/MoaB family molybdenum cofactor biosynthesis protein [Sporolactobacillus shoreae]
MSAEEHKKLADQQVSCKVITISDTRTRETDKSGMAMIELIQEHGFLVSSYEVVKDEKASIQRAVLSGCSDEHVDVVLTNGGTGITKRDVTIEAVSSLIEKKITGFGELFRMISYTEDIGSAAMMSRAVAGTLLGKAIFSMPGSTGAVRLAMRQLILPELAHVVWELKRQ